MAQTGGVQPAIDALEEVPKYYAKEKSISSPSLKLQRTIKMLQNNNLQETVSSFGKHLFSGRAVDSPDLGHVTPY